MREDKISLCITTKDRPEMLVRAIQSGIDPRISEIIIYNDYSSEENNVKYKDLLKGLKKYHPIKVRYSITPVGMSRAKMRAISFASNEWCIILDDDNELIKTYIDSLYDSGPWYPEVIYCPSFAIPNFDYRDLHGFYDKKNAPESCKRPNYIKHLNTCNYFVNREQYLKNWVENTDVIAADTIWFAYNWLKNGNQFCILPGMHYHHHVHEGSGWRKDLEENRRKAKEIEGLIRQL